MLPVKLSQILAREKNDWSDCHLLMFSKEESEQ